MNRLLIPLVLVLLVILLLSVQCTITWRWPIGDIHLELLPPILLYAAFTLNLPLALLLGIFSALMYDSFSSSPFAASLLPYFVAITIFSMLRPIFFRDRVLTQLLSGFVFAWIALQLQWLFSGKFSIPWRIVFPRLIWLSFYCSILSVVYFTFLDRLFRLIEIDTDHLEET